ncbi:hypothetical protein BMF94_6038 [Rhodotorula taiwanensis]|uniref:Uncharacterized protein n=1 Tax=Rhodotorula taiwanensis TaxID=741276 RepID=A0A2S5B2F4_9BASI|nr:hypothetical protein BMF94_6038 [Rhodotorula taiwanensis]
MALRDGNRQKLETLLNETPEVRIVLKPYAPPAALGLAGFASSTFITSMWIAGWWGNGDSPGVFFPFVMMFGGLAQFLAGMWGFVARDTLVTVINTMWGSFWLSQGILYYLNAAGTVPPQSIHAHFPELAAWFIPLAAFTWSGAIAALVRDAILACCLFCLAIGSTIACCLFAYGDAVERGIKAAAYFWMLSSLLAWWRVTNYLIEEGYGPKSTAARFVPVFRTKHEQHAPLVVPGLGEPGVKRGMPGVI